MRISDWSSDVCSSDLTRRQGAGAARRRRAQVRAARRGGRPGPGTAEAADRRPHGSRADSQPSHVMTLVERDSPLPPALASPGPSTLFDPYEAIARKARPNWPKATIVGNAEIGRADHRARVVTYV